MSTRLAGAVRMAFSRHGDRVVADRLYREGNCRISSELRQNGDIPAWFLITTGGGYTEGEHYENEIAVGADAHVILTTQTPGYVLKCEHGQETTQSTHLTLRENAVLEYYTDEIIPYQHAIYRQRTSIDMAAGATLIYMDGVSSGWSPDAQPFRYTRLNLHTTVHRMDRLLLNDHMIIDPTRDPMQHMGYLGMYSEFLTVTVISEQVDQAMVDRMRAAMTEYPDTLYGISLLEEGGMILRIVGRSAHTNRQVAWTFIHAYRESELHLPHLDLRKP